MYFGLRSDEEARKHYEQALESGEKLGKNASYVVAQTQDGLGYLYSSLGKYQEAEELLDTALNNIEQALAKFEKSESKMNEYQKKQYLEMKLDLIGALSHIGFLYREQKLFDKAEEFYRKAVNIATNEYPKDQDNINLVLSEINNNLGTLYQAIGDKLRHVDQNNKDKNYQEAKKNYEKAEERYSEAVQQYENTQKDTFLPFAILLRNLAKVYEELEKYKEAEPLYDRIIDIRKSRLEKDHPDVIQSLVDQGKLFREREMYNEAECSYHKSLKLIDKLIKELKQEREKRFSAKQLSDLANDSLLGLAKLYRKSKNSHKLQLINPQFKKINQLSNKERISFEEISKIIEQAIKISIPPAKSSTNNE